jgi:hypothetical protein
MKKISLFVVIVIALIVGAVGGIVWFLMQLSEAFLR